MRLIAIWFFFIAACVWAYKNWFQAALILVASMAIIERPDIPRQVLGIPGLNPWNLLFVFTLFAFFLAKKEKVPSPGPGIVFLLCFYAFVVLVAFLREFNDLGGMIEFAEMHGIKPVTKTDLLKDDVLNTFKYVGPALLIYYGCNSMARLKETLWVLVGMNGLLGLLIIKSMGFDALSGGEFMEETAIRRIDRDVGYYRSDLAILLSGGVWVIFGFATTQKHVLIKWGLFGLAGACALAIGLSGGRAGMGILALLGLIFGIFRWRSLLIMAPLVGLLLLSTVPAVQERLLQGFAGDEEEQSSDADGSVDMMTVTSGRTEVWPYIIEQIKKDPFFGSGRRSMQRTGISTDLSLTLGQTFPHPHNAYLQLFLDNGLVLGLPIVLLYIILVKRSFTFLRDDSLPVYRLVGTTSLAYVFSFVVGAIAQQSFYPFAGSVSMWVSIALLLRVTAEQRMINTGKTSAHGPAAWNAAGKSGNAMSERSPPRSWILGEETEEAEDYSRSKAPISGAAPNQWRQVKSGP